MRLVDVARCQRLEFANPHPGRVQHQERQLVAERASAGGRRGRARGRRVDFFALAAGKLHERITNGVRLHARLVEHFGSGPRRRRTPHRRIAPGGGRRAQRSARGTATAHHSGSTARLADLPTCRAQTGKVAGTPTPGYPRAGIAGVPFPLGGATR